jgi:hypothetical protein
MRSALGGRHGVLVAIIGILRNDEVIASGGLACVRLGRA